MGTSHPDEESLGSDEIGRTDPYLEIVQCGAVDD